VKLFNSKNYKKQSILLKLKSLYFFESLSLLNFNYQIKFGFKKRLDLRVYLNHNWLSKIKVLLIIKLKMMIQSYQINL